MFYTIWLCHTYVRPFTLAYVIILLYVYIFNNVKEIFYYLRQPKILSKKKKRQSNIQFEIKIYR